MDDRDELIARLRETPLGAAHSFPVEGPQGEPCTRVVPYGNMLNEAADELERLAALESRPAPTEERAHWASDLGALQEARSVLQMARTNLLDQQRQNSHIVGVYGSALSALEPALGMLSVLVERAATDTTPSRGEPTEGLLAGEGWVFQAIRI